MQEIKWSLQPSPNQSNAQSILLLNDMPVGVLFEYETINELVVKSLNQLNRISNFIQS